MPDGLMQWYDEHRGEGRVIRNGREYPVRAADVEPHARVPGARVHFDVERQGGVAVAAGVRLREGTRVSRRQRRFGDMAGARRPDTRGTAPFAHPHPELGLRLATHPEVVARRWAERIADQDVTNAMLLYAPDAVVHAGDVDLRGRRVQTWLSGSGLLGHVQGVTTAGAGEHIVVRWIGPDDRPDTCWMRMAHGEIAEQWLAGAHPHREPQDVTGSAEPVVEVVARDEAAGAVKAYAEQKIRRVVTLAGEPVLYARVKLATAPDPAVERPASAQATLDVNGRLVRARVAAHTAREAVDLLERRLRDRLEHRAEHELALRHAVPAAGPGEWRHGQERGERPAWFDRPVDEREVVRRKTFSVGELTVDEAAFDMEMLGHDFHLFRELATGDEAVLYRKAQGRYGLRRVQHSPVAPVAAMVPLDLDESPAPVLSIDEALAWLSDTGEPFVVFSDPDTARGTVAYRRYDGHYGLITPADEPAAPTEPATARRRLRAELDRLERVRAALLDEGLDAETESASVAELSSLDQHPADLGTETFERERDLSLLDDVDAEIADVHRALLRVDRGTYGRCEACDRVIPDDRLAAVPATRFCLEHQSASEVIAGLAP